MGNSIQNSETLATSAVVPFLFNVQQEDAMDKIVEWFAGCKNSAQMGNPVKAFLLQGFAGTGKTTLVKELLRRLGISLARIALIAPTNRAAKVLSNKTGLIVKTMHSLIYRSEREELNYQRSRLRMWQEASSFAQLADLLVKNNESDLEDEFEAEWEAEYDGDPSRDKAAAKALFFETRHKILLELESVTLPEDPEERQRLFEVMQKERIKLHRDQIKEILAEDMPVRKREPHEIREKYDLIICDEASMVNEIQGRDLTGYGVPVIMVGDPFQLPPVKAKAFWDGARPDVQLTRIERQKGVGAGIPLAGEQLRNGKRMQRNESLNIYPRNTMNPEEWMAADQIIAGTHKTREKMCSYIRRLRGYDTTTPQVGERLVSNYNDKEIGIMNGELYTVRKCEMMRSDSVMLLDLIDPYGVEIDNVMAWTRALGGRSQTNFLDDEFGKFWWGYCITCHQSQGSEWKHVVVCDDWPRGDKETYDRWLYTAITRASQRCDLIQ